MACIGYLSRPTFLRTAVGATARGARGRVRRVLGGAEQQREREGPHMGANCAVATTLILCVICEPHICGVLWS